MTQPLLDQNPFTLRGRNPDVLTCIANLSNDEVFTPPEFAGRMLDTLTTAWAADHNGADLWANPSVRFLDPFAKSGVFLREITNRLTKGLATVIPDLQQRVDHILTKQVFGIGITHLTSLLARRSVYCSKFANGPHSIGTSFTGDQGNIWFERMDHTWDENKCRYCGAPKAIFDRDDHQETHAYAFIHTEDIKARINNIFGGPMQFDVIIGNPPYQMKGGAGGSSDSSIYHLFVEQAMRLEPRYLSMVTPARWLAGGRGMDGFRTEMLSGGKIRELVDYPVSKDVFPGVEVKGGISYFLWDHGHNGVCQVTTIRGREVIGPVARALDEFDVFVRDSRAVDILHKVKSFPCRTMDTIVSSREPFKLESNFDGFHLNKKEGSIALCRIAATKRRSDWIMRNEIVKNSHLIDTWKVLLPKAASDGGQKIPDIVLGKPLVVPPPSVCTGSYLVISAGSEAETLSIESYYATKFFRFLVSLRKITQDAFSHMYTWVPQQSWDRVWTDTELYAKYGLTPEEIEYIESVIKPMNLGVSDD